MKFRAGVFLACFVAAVLSGPRALAADDLDQQLNSEYRDKVFTLRHFYEGDHLEFQPDGTLLGFATPGPWTVDGQIAVSKIGVHGHTLKIKGRRVCLAYNGEGKPFRDVISLIEESKAKDWEKLLDSYRKRQVEIEIELAAPHPALSDAESAMHAVFLADGESMRDLVPDYWHDYFDRVEGRPRRVPDAGGPVYFVKSGAVSVPTVISTPNPEFSVEARRAKYQGTMTVSLIVDPNGSVRDVQVNTPLGMGLDEKAVDAVRTWTFHPAMRNGTPVAVQLMVQVDFHLY